ncbi:hypothetical protein GGI05_006635, partial [Coemansia sp. RSA 2603]
MDEEHPAARRFTLPECHAVSRTKFSLSSDNPGKSVRSNPVYANIREHAHLHAPSIQHLQTLSSQPYASLVHHDKQLLWRLYHRNRNQHRSGVHFRKLQALRRVLRAWDAARPHALVRGLLAACSGKPGSGSGGGGTWVALPCAVHVRALAARLAEVVRLARVARDTCRRVFDCFTALVRQTLFMPLALVVNGVAARLHVVFGVWGDELLDLYRVLCRWLPGLPACPEDLAGRAVDWPLVDADELAACQPVAGALEIRAYAEQSVRRDDSNEKLLPSEEDNVLPAEEDDIIPADDAL